MRLNPKAPVYFVALFTMVLSPNMPLWQLAIYGRLDDDIAISYGFPLWCCLLSQTCNKCNNRFQRLGHWIRPRFRWRYDINWDKSADQ